MSHSRPLLPEDSAEQFTDGTVWDEDAADLAAFDDESDAASPPSSPPKAKSQSARNAVAPFPGYAALRRGTIKILYHRYDFATHFAGRALIPNGPPRGPAKKDKDWQMITRVASNDAVQMQPGATLDILRAVHADPAGYDHMKNGNSVPRIERRLVKPGSEDRKRIRRLSDKHGIVDACEAFNTLRVRNGLEPISEQCMRDEITRMGSKTVKTPTGCMQSRKEESKWKAGRLAGMTELELRMKAYEDKIVKHGDVISAAQLIQTDMEAAVSLGRPDGLTAFDPHGIAYWDENTQHVRRRPLTKHQRLWLVNAKGEEIEADTATEEELAEATYTEAKPRLKGKFEKSASGLFGVAWEPERGAHRMEPFRYTSNVVSHILE
eukprot:COSAG01_NODE_11049_length_2020_cov_6.391983_3_plen_379_part_00